MVDSEKIRILLDQGLSAYGLGNVGEALQVWQSVLAMDPGNTKAKEYIRFVEESWGPRQERKEGLGESYRPDEGSGEIPEPDVVEQEPAPDAPIVQDEVSEEIDISVDVPPEDLGGFEKDAFTPPAKSILAGDQWGNLYDFGKRRPTAVDEKTAPLPQAAAERSDAVPIGAPKTGLTPAQEQVAPLAGDWSNVLTPEEKEAQQEAQPEASAASTLPPHPGDVEDIEIIEEVQEFEPVQEPAPPAQAMTSDAMTRDELAPTRKYDSVPTLVRPPDEAIPAEAVPPATTPPVEPAPQAPAPAAQAPQVQESPARDLLDRFPVDPGPVVGFLQTPRPETTPSLGSPILQPGGSELLDLVAGGGGSVAEPAAVPGIAAVSEVDSLLKGAEDMLELDDFSGAIELLDKVLEQEPGHPQAKKMRGEAEQELLSMLSSKLGDMNRTPRLRMSQDEIIWLNLDNRAGFVLSLVDGSLSLDEIVSICGLPQLEGMRILVQLLLEKVIEIN